MKTKLRLLTEDVDTMLKSAIYVQENGTFSRTIMSAKATECKVCNHLMPKEKRGVVTATLTPQEVKDLITMLLAFAEIALGSDEESLMETLARLKSAKDHLECQLRIMPNKLACAMVVCHHGNPIFGPAIKALYTSLWAYLLYEAPTDEQNLQTFIAMLNAYQEDEGYVYTNAVDFLFEDLETKESYHLAVQQYKQFRSLARDCMKEVVDAAILCATDFQSQP